MDNMASQKDLLLIDYIHDDDPLGMPFLLKMSDLIKYLI